jgi:poly(A) polymerase
MDVQAVATEIVRKLNRAGYIAYFAGGWVRDHLMGHPCDDIDIATNAPPEKILDLFPKTILVGLAFGIVVVVEKGHQFEVATFRKDINYVNGRTPTHIELSTPEEDASRRDFTINGMFYDPIEHVIHDYVHGAEDIHKKVIRTIGNPDERFVEDRLRMIRAVRFAARFGFTIDPDTQEAIRASADTLFPAVAPERIWQELNKMSRYGNFDVALIEMHRLNLLPEIFADLKGVHLHDIKNAVAGFKHFPKNVETILYLLELFPKITAEEAKELCLFLRTSNDEARLAEFLTFMRRSIESEHVLEIIDLHGWSHLYANPSAEKCLQVVASTMPPDEKKTFLSKHEERMNTLQKHIDRIKQKKPLVNAAFLQGEGIVPGKLMGTLLKEAERLAIMNDLNDPNQVMALLKMTHAWKERL